MVVAWVYRYKGPEDAATKHICALLLPSASDESAWAELDVLPSQKSGFGLYPSLRGQIDWSNLIGFSVSSLYDQLWLVSERARNQKAKTGCPRCFA